MLSLPYFGTREKHDSETKRKLVLLNIFLILGFFILVLMGTIAFVQDAFILTFADFSMAGLFCGALYYLHRTGNESNISFYGIITILFFFCFLFSIGGVKTTSFMWTYSFPLFSLYLLGLSRGTLVTGILFCFCFCFLIIDYFSNTINIYSIDFTLRFLPSFLVVSILASLVEKSRSSSRDAMLEKQHLLAKTIQELQKKETELEEVRDQLEVRVSLRTAELEQANKQLRIEIEDKKIAEEESLRLESKLLRAEKMELLGRLAGGVAHDLNNVLSGIVTYPELLLLDLSPDSEMYEPLESIRSAGARAAAIVQDLLTLARRGIRINERINLNDIIKAHLQSPEFITLQKKHPLVTVEKQLLKQLHSISGSAVHLQKTLMNLLINSFEAIESEGRITLTTENHEVSPSYQINDPPPGNYVLLIISDTGIGIPHEEINMIFEPFYSSKKMGNSGTGLGMTVVWGTVKDHKGYLDIHSSLDTGTTIKLFFPICEQKEHETLPFKKSPLTFEKGNKESILVVDDTSEQRLLMQRILTTLNYCVEHVTNGKDAVSFLKSGHCDLVLLDMIMGPGMDGLETFQAIKKIRPDQKVIIVSGYSDTERMNKALKMGVCNYINKPYSLEKLAKVVKKELSS